MNVLIDDLFTGITCAEYESLYFDEDFNRLVGRELRMGRLLLHFERRPDRIQRKVQYEPERDPDSPAGQAFGTSRASFIEELDYDPRSRRGSWRTIPNLFPERVSNAGTIEFVEAPNGTRRIVRGAVKVSLFGFGRLVERMIVSEIVKSYANTTRITNDWIAKR
jgi:uncharacterized protein DUF2505